VRVQSYVWSGRGKCDFQERTRRPMGASVFVWGGSAGWLRLGEAWSSSLKAGGS